MRPATRSTTGEKYTVHPDECAAVVFEQTEKSDSIQTRADPEKKTLDETVRVTSGITDIQNV